MIRKISTQDLLDLTGIDIPEITESDKDEMAIPSYLHWNPLIRWLMWRRYEVISSLATFSKGMAILEFGCGIGVFLPELDRTCGKVYAFDLFPQYAKRLSDRLDLKVNFINSLMEIPNQSLDIIVAADVLEHIKVPDEYFKMFYEKLKSDGRMIISGPTETIFYKLGRIFAGFGDKGDYHHTNIDDLIQKVGERYFNLIHYRTLPFIFHPYLFKVCEFKKVLSFV